MAAGSDISNGTLHRLTAFSSRPEGGNPAGVWVGDVLPDPGTMRRVAADVGYSETAFVIPRGGFSRTIRYYSREAEVLFCGHATIATGVLLGELDGDGRYVFSTASGDVTVTVGMREGLREAAFTSVEPLQSEISDTALGEYLAALHWTWEDLDLSIPPVRAYAGVWHIVLAVSSLPKLNSLDYDFATLKRLMLRDGLTTLQLVWRESPEVFHSRNPFPVGGVVEDPATGAAAAALGGYLRAAAMVKTPYSLTIYQGNAMGRPSTIRVEIPASGGIVVAGQAVKIL
jgi:PhzF family phenazine biosynthesis protein